MTRFRATAEGNIPFTAEEEAQADAESAAYLIEKAKASIPQAVTMRQARLALYGAGLLATVNSAIAGMTGAQGEAARIEWEFSSEVKRNQPLVMALAPVLGMTQAQLDQLFVTAAGL